MKRFSTLLTCSLTAMLCLSFLTLPTAQAANKTKRTRPITKPKFDPTAEKVELFAGMKSGQLETRVIAKNENRGRVLIENKTDQPLTIILPGTFVAVPVHSQFQAPGFDVPGNGNGQGNSQSQSVGSGLNSQQNNSPFGNNNGLGNNFFSIPPKKVVSVTYKSVCLNYGLKNPTPKTKMRMVATSAYTKDVALKALLEKIATGKIDHKTAQAVAWHLASKMSWEELTHKKVKHLGGLAPSPYFTKTQIAAAKKFVAVASDGVKENNKPRVKISRVGK